MTVDSTECETCWYYDYDEEYDEYYCMMDTADGRSRCKGFFCHIRVFIP